MFRTCRGSNRRPLPFCGLTQLVRRLRMPQSESGTERCLSDLGLIKCGIAVLIVHFIGKGGDVGDVLGRLPTSPPLTFAKSHVAFSCLYKPHRLSDAPIHCVGCNCGRGPHVPNSGITVSVAGPAPWLRSRGFLINNCFSGFATLKYIRREECRRVLTACLRNVVRI